jgi:hypothetical protein
VQTIYDQKITPRREGFLIATLSSLFQVQTVVDKDQREAAAVIRKQLIDSYMYLLAAPFLAIAVYYLLQIIADDTAEPILVLMAFATGLISDAIVSRITHFAENTIARLPGRDDADEAQDATPAPTGSGAPQQASAQPQQPAAPVVQSAPVGPEETAERLAAAFVAKVEGQNDNAAEAPARADTQTPGPPSGETSGS